MIDKLKLYRGQSFDPFFNLVVEEYLLQNTDEGCCTLYLWQNQNTVVIGRNQNAFKECRTTLLEDEGGKLARRLSGGGAVFHDLGNLNFTFLVPAADYDLDKQLKVIELACEKLGVKVERSGRNDILADGRKFSGNAFYKNGPRAYHHGTLMVDVDREKMGRYLNPSKAKLSSKGVDSVRSRVVNLKELASDTTIELLSQKLAEAFGQVYGLTYEEIGLTEQDKAAMQPLFEKYSSWEWRLGREIPFTFECGERFPWGSVQIQLMVDGGRVKEAEVYSDSMDWSIAEKLKAALELYVSGSLNVFNHRTNVELSNRLVCFDIKQLGKQLKKLGMLIVQDQVWNRVTINRAEKKSTRYYMDEFHLLLKEEQTAAYSVEIWKRFRKWGGIPTAITQNVKDLLSSREVENIFENSDFVLMLNQAQGDREILARQLNISPQQMKYVTHTEAGEGLIFYGNVVLPFLDRFPQNTELYRVMTTRPEEVGGT